MRRLALALALIAGAAAVAVFAGAWGGEREDGTASLWITRDRGQTVLLTTTVPAGITAMQALDRAAELETRYGGRFVQSIDGLAGSASARRDWFYFVNGYEGDRSASEYRLRDGDVEWWDYRPWERPGEARVVVGAFPEPFLHGYAGQRRPTAIRFRPGLERGARELGRLLGARSVARSTVPAPAGHNRLDITAGSPSGLQGGFCKGGGSAGDPVCFMLAGDSLALAREPAKVRFRYQAVGRR